MSTNNSPENNADGGDPVDPVHKRIGTKKRLSHAFSTPGRWKDFTFRVWNKLFDDEVFGRSAQLAYYWLFSLFPLVIFLTTIVARSPLSKALTKWLNMLSRILPGEAFTLVESIFFQITGQHRGLLSFSVLAIIWSSSSGMGAVITSLNKAFDAVESRPWWQERILAVFLTLGLTVFIIGALLLIFFGEMLSNLVAAKYGLGTLFTFAWNFVQWPVIILLVLLAIELIFYFAPNIKSHWEMFTPGALFALACWLIISFGFRYFVSHFLNYNAIYGGLGSVMVLMLWLYLTGATILIGGVINAVRREYA